MKGLSSNLKELKPFQVMRAFKLSPPQVYVLETKGTLPRRKPRTVNREWIVALSGWCVQKRGGLPQEAIELLHSLNLPIPSSESRDPKEVISNE